MNDLAELKAALPLYLERYLAERIQRKTPSSYLLHCPFHQDKTPSFHAHNKQGTWLFHCFSCSAAGSVLDLHAQLHSLSLADSITSTAEALGIQIDQHTPSDSEKQQWTERRKRSQDTAKQQRLAEANRARITAHLQSQREQLLAAFMEPSWKVALLDSSPLIFDVPEALPHDFLKSLFAPTDVLWLGDPNDSGQPHHARHFKPCCEWTKQATLPPRLAAGTFKAGSISRSLDSVHRAPYIILESDDLIGRKPETAEEKEHNKALSYALIRYAQERLGLHLAAVIDTGNKSLHAWFKRPPDPALAALLQLAEGLSLDRGVIERSAALPLRLPNTPHEATGIPARLLYLNPQTF